MYSEYKEFLKKADTKKNVWKSDPKYTYVLEHISRELGEKYLQYIHSEFSEITDEQIKEFVKINDFYGYPIKEKYNDLECSPTTLRYIYHALIILKLYKAQEKMQKRSIVELGCGYGGLFLAICYFSRIKNIHINSYFLVDLPEARDLIGNYLLQNNKHIHIPYLLVDSDSMDFIGNDLSSTSTSSSPLFFISNYCITEIEEEYRQKYVEKLVSKCDSGFIVWQTVFGLDISPETIRSVVKDKHTEIIEETPQTSTDPEYKNYFVAFFLP
jgi:hypothetical protein